MREQRKVVTILFCDLVGSTALGETTDPEALRARMRRYFADLRIVIERHGGSVEKFVGDAVMAVFGIPVAHEDDALPCRAATEMRNGPRTASRPASGSTPARSSSGEGETLVTGDAVNVAPGSSRRRIRRGAHRRGDEVARSRCRAARANRTARAQREVEPVDAYRLLEVLPNAEGSRDTWTPLVGRERERRRIWRDYDDAVADGSCRLFTLLGPRGSGNRGSSQTSSTVPATPPTCCAVAAFPTGRALHTGRSSRS